MPTFSPLPPPHSQAKAPRRFEAQMREACRVRHFSLRTEEAYWMWTRRFILFYGKRHPREMGADEITEFLTDLAVQQDVAPSTQTQKTHKGPSLYQKTHKGPSLYRPHRPHHLWPPFQLHSVRLSKVAFDICLPTPFGSLTPFGSPPEETERGKKSGQWANDTCPVRDFASLPLPFLPFFP